MSNTVLFHLPDHSIVEAVSFNAASTINKKDLVEAVFYQSSSDFFVSAFAIDEHPRA